MKSRGIAVGASVLALTLTGGTEALAGVGDLSPTTTVGADVTGQANVQLGGVGAKTNLDTSQWTQTRHGRVRHDGETNGSVGVKGPKRPAPALGGRSPAGADAAAGLTTKVVVQGKSGLSARAHGQPGLEGAGSRVKAGSRLPAAEHARGLDPNRVRGKAVRAQKAAAGRSERALHKGKDRGIAHDEVSRPSKGAHFLPLEGIGREVGNPLQLQLAGWLLLLTGATGFGVTRITRRRHRIN